MSSSKAASTPTSKPGTPTVPRNAKLSAYYTAAVNPTTSASLPSTSKSTSKSTIPSTPPRQNPNPNAISTKPTSTTTSPTAASSSPRLTDLPIDSSSGKQSVINHANSLMQQLPLPALMSRCIELRRQADHFSTSLETSSRAYYTHLASSSRAATSARHLSDTVVTSHVPQLERNLTISRQIVQRLDVPRRRVDALHAVQRLAALETGAQLLASEMPTLVMDVTSGLCTEPELARAKLFIAVKRASVVSTALKELRQYSETQFGECSQVLTSAMSHTCVALKNGYFPSSHEHDDHEEHEEQIQNNNNINNNNNLSENEDGTDVLSIEDATRLRLLLDDDEHTVRADFLRAVSRYASAPTPTSAAVAAAGASPVATARMHALFCFEEILPRMRKAEQWYNRLFKDFDEEKHDLMVCLSSIGEDAIASRVRNVLQSFSLSTVDEARGVSELLKSVNALVRGRGGGSGETTEERSAVSVVIAAVVEGVVSYVRKCVRECAVQKLHDAFGHVLSKTSTTTTTATTRKSSNDISAVVQAVRNAVSEILSWEGEIAKGGEIDILSTQNEDRKDEDDAGITNLLERAARSLVPIDYENNENGVIDVDVDDTTIDDMTFTRTARLARVCDDLGSDFPELKKTSESLREATKTHACQLVTGFLHARFLAMTREKQLKESGHLVNKAVLVLQQAEEIAKTADVPALRKPRDVSGSIEDDEDGFLDDGWLARAVLRDWIAVVRNGSKEIEIENEVIREMQIDAAELIHVVRYDVVVQIAEAAREGRGGGVGVKQGKILDSRKALEEATKRRTIPSL